MQRSGNAACVSSAWQLNCRTSHFCVLAQTALLLQRCCCKTYSLTMINKDDYMIFVYPRLEKESKRIREILPLTCHFLYLRHILLKTEVKHCYNADITINRSFSLSIFAENHTCETDGRGWISRWHTDAATLLTREMKIERSRKHVSCLTRRQCVPTLTVSYMTMVIMPI